MLILSSLFTLRWELLLPSVSPICLAIQHTRVSLFHDINMYMYSMSLSYSYIGFHFHFGFFPHVEILLCMWFSPGLCRATQYTDLNHAVVTCVIVVFGPWVCAVTHTVLIL